MGLVCFLLDLCSLSPPLLKDLKQGLLQLANFYAISSSPSPRLQQRRRPDFLRDRIGLCYIFKNRSSSSHELRVAYSPRGNFSLRGFHHAVNSLPSDAFSPEIGDSGSLTLRDLKLSSLLSDQNLYSWGEDKDIFRKVIVLSSCLPEKVDSAVKRTLMDAADKCVSVEFVLFEQSSSHLSNMQEDINCFSRSVSDLDNCSFQTFLPDSRVLHGLVKQWLQELKDDNEATLQARFIFKSNLVGSVNQISCSLSISIGEIVDGFNSCQTCRCHGYLLDNAVQDTVEKPACSVTGHELGTSDVIQNSVKVGDKIILFMPTFDSSLKVKQASSPIEFNVIERTNLRSICEGAIFGYPFLVSPLGSIEVENSSDEMDLSELNAKVFQGICGALHSMDQGLICSSKYNVETMKEASFHCYYFLQPSDNGPMLLRRLAGSEEVLPLPDANQYMDSSATDEIQNCIRSSLLTIELRDYNPVMHERGFHQMLNLLVKESLHFGSVPPTMVHTASELNSKPRNSSEAVGQSNFEVDPLVVEEESPNLELKAREEKATCTIEEEWEQLVEVPEIYSPTCISKPKMDRTVISPTAGNKQVDEKTSRILERLELPRQLKVMAVSPISVTISGTSETCTPPIKKPLIPFQSTQVTDQSVTSSQLLKPSFQRLKRKHR